MGLLPGIKAFVAAVLGGIGNIPGAALGGLLIGVLETLVGGSAFSTYRDAIAFAILILILLFKTPPVCSENRRSKRCEILAQQEDIAAGRPRRERVGVAVFRALQ